jgi:hypothetical protein
MDRHCLVGCLGNCLLDDERRAASPALIGMFIDIPMIAGQITAVCTIRTNSRKPSSPRAQPSPALDRGVEGRHLAARLIGRHDPVHDAAVFDGVEVEFDIKR